MTKFLTELVTSKTPILSLKQKRKITDEEKLEVLDLDSEKAREYINSMYYKYGKWYYFKLDDTNSSYPFYLLDELMGFYLAKSMDLPTVPFHVAKVKRKYGLASPNFKSEQFDYYQADYFTDKLGEKGGAHNIDRFKSFTIDVINEEVFLTRLFKLFSLDMYMLQKDRKNDTLQFQINKNTKEFNLAPIHGYSNCFSCVGMKGMNIPNVIVPLDKISIRSLLRKYPVFREWLTFCIEQDMTKIWHQICHDYHFNQNTLAYETVESYYQEKGQSQKVYIKEMLQETKK